MTDCHKCIYRGNVPNSVHCSCKHPAALELISFSDELFDFLKTLTNEHKLKKIYRLNLQAAEQGIEGGYFIWPFNFDPTWLQNCDGFEEAI